MTDAVSLLVKILDLLPRNPFVYFFIALLTFILCYPIIKKSVRIIASDYHAMWKWVLSKRFFRCTVFRQHYYIAVDREPYWSEPYLGEVDKWALLECRLCGEISEYNRYN